MVFSKDETSVMFQIKMASDGVVNVHSSTYACDERGNRYPVLCADGIQMDTSAHLKKGEQITITLHFKPLPSRTRVFDIIEGRQVNHSRIYGIHERGHALKIKEPKEMISSTETNWNLFKTDTTMIRGIICGYKPGLMPDTMTVHYNREQFHMSNGIAKPNSTAINKDGTFSCTFWMDRPAWNNLSFGMKQFYNYYVRPGDTLNIRIENYGQWNEKVTYANAQGNPTYQALVTEGEVIYGSMDLLLIPSKDDFQKKLADYGRIAEQLHAYLAQKYHLTPWEVHLLKTQQCLQFAYLQAYYMNDWKHKQEEQGLSSNIPHDDLRFLHQLPWNDATLPILKSWTSAVIYKFLETGLDIHSKNPFVQWDIDEKKPLEYYDYNSQQAQIAHHKRQVVIKILLLFLFVALMASILFYLYLKRQKTEKRRLTEQYLHAKEEMEATQREIAGLQKIAAISSGKEALLAVKERKVQELQQQITLLKARLKIPVDTELTSETSIVDITQHFHAIAHPCLINDGGRHKLRNPRSAKKEEWILLTDMLKKQYPHFFSFITTEKSLSQQEYKICLLSRLQFDTSEIATLIGTSAPTVSNARKRLAVKLFQIESATLLDEKLTGLT